MGSAQSAQDSPKNQPEPASTTTTTNTTEKKIDNNGKQQQQQEPTTVVSDRVNVTQGEIHTGIENTIGNTPMLWLSPKLNKTKAKIALKLENGNPMASVKDRIAYAMVDEAEREGKLKRRDLDDENDTTPQYTVIESTSGNTGIALAQLCAARGYRLILTMPETMSLERRALLKILGAEVYITPANRGMKGAQLLAQKFHSEIEHSFICKQFSNPANPKAHRETTGPEIWKQCNGQMDYFLAGVGTGGTITGVAQYLESVDSTAECIAIEPQESAVLFGGKPGPHKIAGIGPGFIADNFDKTLIKRSLKVASDDAIAMTRRLPKEAGIFCGISGGAAVCAALQLAETPEAEGKTIVTIIPSFGERYLSTIAFASVKDEVANMEVTQPPPPPAAMTVPPENAGEGGKEKETSAASNEPSSKKEVGGPSTPTESSSTNGGDEVHSVSSLSLGLTPRSAAEARSEL